MPDITMCKNKDCTIKETCYRYNANPNPYWQSYTTFSQNIDGYCDYYWNNDKQTKANKL